MKKKWVGLGLMLGLATGVWGGTVEIEMAGTNAVTLNWEAEEGLTYRVETTTDLNEPVVWSNATPEGLSFPMPRVFASCPRTGRGGFIALRRVNPPPPASIWW